MPLKGVPLPMLQKLLGHMALAYTQRYLADVDLIAPALDKQIEAAMYVPKPKLVTKARKKSRRARKKFSWLASRSSGTVVKPAPRQRVDSPDGPPV